ncbi:hypothetical protein QCN29_25575 [Streptomyces sp. HNM0663]|uniref:Uncharacterized protein n=1 Tax=Streptomyces chengmaiensis TaxID=3040919 RepID=A0ABT6HTP3_9ACTN|nr:hypothetical protein [Streptomyces chengmaiensis]MDH2392092.1 hypothetical protein [Streptomyces chengmaiensis]
MSFEDEWARHISDAGTQSPTSTRLNQLDGGGGQGGKPKLHVTPAVLRGRANKAETEAAKEFAEAHKSVISKTSEVSGSMKGFASDEAFAAFLTSWKKGVKYVSGRIGNEGLAKELRSAANSFGDEEAERKRSFDKERKYQPGDVI